MTVSEQHDIKAKMKVVDADKHGLCWTFRDGKHLISNKMDVKGTTCQHFSLRAYVANTREVNGNACWPFPIEEGNLALPPIEAPQYRWWNCRKCVDGIKTSSQRSVEKNNIKDLASSSWAYDANSAPGHQTLGKQFSTSDSILQDKGKEDTLNHTEMAECLTSELKSKNAMSSSPSEFEKDKRDQRVVTEETIEHCRNEGIVSMDLQEGRSDIEDATKKPSGMLQCSSKFEESSNMTEKHFHEQGVDKTSPDMGWPEMQTVLSVLVSKVDDGLVQKESKHDAFQKGHQASNSWEYFSRSKNIFEQISMKIREKETQQATSQILPLGSKIYDVHHTGLESNKPENIKTVSLSVSYDKNVHPDQQILAKENNMGTISEKVMKPLLGHTLESNIKEGSCSVTASVVRNNVSCTISPLRVSDLRNDVVCTKSIGRLDLEHKDRSNFTAGKECLDDIPTNQGSLDTGNDLLTKVKGSESRTKKRSRKKRSIADIIASDSSVPENKETGESNSGDIMEENICRAENHKQFPLKKDAMIVPEDVVATSLESRLDTSNISEVPLNTNIKNVKHKKRQPEKLKVMKNQQSIEIQSPNACSTIFEKDNTSNSRKCEIVSNTIQMPEDATNSVYGSKDNLPQDNSIQLEDGHMRQRCSGMDDDIPMDVVELMAKNQRERGLSKFQKIPKIKDGHKVKKIKVKESNVTDANKPIKIGGTEPKQRAARRKSLAQPKKSQKAYLSNHVGSTTSGDDTQIHVSQVSSIAHSFIPDTEAIKSSSLKDRSATLQTSQWFNQCGKYSNFVAPIFSGTNVACNAPSSICDGSNLNGAISGFGQQGIYHTSGIGSSCLQVHGAARDVAHMQVKILYNEGTNASSESIGPEVSKYHNNSESSLHYTSVSSAINPNEKFRNTEITNLTSSNSDVLPGPQFNIPFQNYKGKVVSNLSGKMDRVAFPAYFERQSNSALLQQVNAQARPIFGNKHPVSVSSAPVLRLMGQSVSVPFNCGIEQNIVTEKKDTRTFSELLQSSSQKQVPWFHPATSASSGVSHEDRVFKLSVPAQNSISVKDKPQSSRKTIPPVPKFNSVHFGSNGHSGSSSSSGSSCTVSGKAGKADVVLESAIAKKQFSFQDPSLFVMQQKKCLQCPNDYNGNLHTLSPHPPTSQTAEFLKGASPTKGFRSSRPQSTNGHANRYHTTAMDIFSHNRYRQPQSFSISGNPSQSQAEEAQKAKSSSLNKENDQSGLFGKSSCNVEICTLNQNPAELILDDEEDTNNFLYEHLVSAPRAVSHSKGKRDVQVPNGQKRRRALKKKHLQEFLAHKNGHVSDLINTGVGTMLQEMHTVRQADKSTTSELQSLLVQK